MKTVFPPGVSECVRVRVSVHAWPLNGNLLQELAGHSVTGFDQIGGMREIINRHGQRAGGREIEDCLICGKGGKDAGLPYGTEHSHLYRAKCDTTGQNKGHSFGKSEMRFKAYLPANSRLLKIV